MAGPIYLLDPLGKPLLSFRLLAGGAHAIYLRGPDAGKPALLGLHDVSRWLARGYQLSLIPPNGRRIRSRRRKTS